jgi:hypothetical protein
MEGVPKTARVDTRHWLLSIFFLISFPRPASLYCEEYVCECVERVNELALLPNYTASETFLHKLGAVRSVDWIFYHWGAGLAVTGRIRDIGQNILQSPQYTAGPSVQKRTRLASPSQYKNSCSVFVPTIKWLALDFSAHTLSLIFLWVNS